jgi:DNA topoisomerase-1
VRLLAGRYGPYVTDGEVNASLPRGRNPDEVTLAEALELLAQRAAAGPPARRRGRSSKSPAKVRARKSDDGPDGGPNDGSAAAEASAARSAARGAKRSVVRASGGGGRGARRTR